MSLFFLLVLVPAHAETSIPSDEPVPQWEKVDPDLRDRLNDLSAEANVEFVLRLADVADLTTVQFQRQEVVQRLRTVAADSQADLLPLLREAGFQVTASFWITNALLVQGPAGQVPVLTTSPRVARLHSNFQVEVLGSESTSSEAFFTASLTWGLERVGAEDIWSELGVRGAGVRVCVSDTGVDVSHPDLAGKMWSDVPGDPQYPGGWIEFGFDGNPVLGSIPHDTHGHGTHTSGTVLGGDASGTAIGMAPEATLMHALVLPRGSGSFAQVIGGIEWCVSPFDADGAPAGRPAHVHSMSWGAEGYMDELVDPIRNSYFAGTLPVAAAGNCGEGCTDSPGNIHDALSIGASDENDLIASFSSGGLVRKSSWSSPPGDWPEDWTVPLLSAPGVDVYSSLPGGSYASWSGTSMATPHVSGCAALMVASNSDLTPEDLRLALVKPAVWFDTYAPSPPDTRYGWGRLDCHSATASVAFNGGIRGIVWDGEDGAPVPEAQLNASSIAEQREGESDDVGAFRIGLKPGVYNVTVSRFGYLPQTVTDITVAPDSWTDLEFFLSPLPRSNITGAAFSSSSGLGIPGVTVEVTVVPVTMEATTGVNGAFVLEKVPEGTYDLLATSPYFQDTLSLGVTVVSGSNSSISFAMDPRRWVAVLGDERDSLSTTLRGDAYYVENPTWDNVIADPCRYDTIVVNHPPIPGTARFNAFLAATDSTGTGVIFLDTYRHSFTGGGIYYLYAYRSDPQQRSYSYDTSATYTFYNVTQSHPILGTGAPGDSIILENTTTRHGAAWFDLFSGESGTILAVAGRDNTGELGPGIAVDERANNRHVLLSLHGASSQVDATDWTLDAEGVFLNAVNWSVGSACPDARMTDFQLDVTPQTGLWHETFQATIQAKNLGSTNGNYTARLFVNDGLEGVQSLPLAPGEVGAVTFEITRDPVGSYAVTIGPHRSSFQVRPPIVDVQVRVLNGTALPGASLTVGRGNSVQEMGETDGNGSVTFDSPGGSHGRYWIVAEARNVPPEGNHYFLSQELLVEDDLAVAFKPTENETVKLELRSETILDGQEGYVHLRRSEMPVTFSRAYAFPTGSLVVARGSYSLWSEVTWTSPGSTWTYETANVTQNVTTSPSARYDFGGRLKAWVDWNQSAENATTDWNITDAYGNDLRDVVQARASILGAGETTFHVPFLSFWNAEGEELASGYVAWSQKPGRATIPPNETVAMVQVDLESGGYPFDNAFVMGLAVLDMEGTELPQVASTSATSVQVVGTVLLSGTPIPVNLTVNGGGIPVRADGSFSHETDLTNGLNALVIRAVDPVGNARQEVYVIYVNASKSDVALVVAPLPAYVNRTSVEVSGMVEFGARLTINGVAVQPEADGSFGVTWDLVEGPNAVVVAAEDYLGNRRQVSYQVVRDTLPPNIVVLSPASGYSTREASISITGTTEPDASLAISGVAVPLEEGNFTYEASLEAGDNTFLVEAMDQAGNLNQTVVRVYREPAFLGVPLSYLSLLLPAVLVMAIGLAYRGHRRRLRQKRASYVGRPQREVPESQQKEEMIPWLRR